MPGSLGPCSRVRGCSAQGYSVSLGHRPAWSGARQTHTLSPERATSISIEVLVEGEYAKRLSPIARERGQPPGEVVAELVRNA
jgi:hypothetical protein